MKVFKFGGASVKDAAGVLNVARILKMFSNETLVVVISAMGKTTNLLEKIVHQYRIPNASPNELQELVKVLKDNHLDVVRHLTDESQVIIEKLNPLFQQLEVALQQPISEDADYDYDRIVSFGELLSTTLVSSYLNLVGQQNQWMDVRQMIITDANFREGNVDWNASSALIVEKMTREMDSGNKMIVTQGFIAGTEQGKTVTLGREGSDFSAAIFANVLSAQSVTIWKDVPGVLNADPKFFPDAVKLDVITYEEAIELAFYGATIIHPKTLKPLQNKNIPLFVKSFYSPEEEGTVIASSCSKNSIPSFIFKRNQILISIFPKDFSFIDIENLSEIFSIISSNKLKINVMQRTALSFSMCVDNVEGHITPVIAALQKHFTVKYNESIELITIRHYQPEVIDRVVQGRKIYLEQKNRTTLQLVVKGY
ncbi:MAG: aspartate kinase [Bacteroidales bacterium]|nr:aspartate kinase [Bacteroidales bacterium]